MGEALTRSLALLAELDPTTLALFVAVCAFGEFAVGVPYVLEGVWLLMGYYLANHVLSVPNFIVLALAAQGGRQVGSICLYGAARAGTDPMARLCRKVGLARLIPQRVQKSRFFGRMCRPSPFSIAASRLVGLRIPVAFMLAARRDLKSLELGVLMSGIVWDALYVSVGLTVGATASLKPSEMLVVALAGLTALYVATFVVRRLVRALRQARRGALNAPADPQ
ncbi:MAG: hypothetical protein HYY32_04505 [Chloroflexi bacterium]|nr:hypothetical protein [Chloroflexota bacterium]